MQTRRWLSILTVALVSGALLLFSAGNGIALQVGDKAPDFTLKAGTGKKITLSDYQGKKPVVLFFFIGAFGNTWTKNVRSFQLAYDKFEAANAQVLGVSVDFSNANRAFSGAHNLSFPLLSDAARKVAIAYGVLYDDPKMVDDPKKVPLFRRAQRSWFVIDKEGVIRYAATTHWSVFDKNDEVLAVLDKL